ncbi:nucleotidyltransferase family protein [Halobellus clavatus]|uniref:CTP:molybdopterin cytidylyltransferase MocA n=1 Tax=Halobellus clavatus TaxID=660517 RepID=A0A1H3FYK3_9EURY|nr:nucleotidyltransferase family protein [Halobellus clavatus]SDX96010.1 CTP:molybdopterin cytidylyltransferase MocA [Halobellus clavatus]
MSDRRSESGGGSAPTTELVGLITAAGESTRMGGFPKPLLTFDGQRFVERLVETYRAAGVDRVVVVLGHEADEVGRRADLSGATVVLNPDYEDGMLSSVRCGVEVAREADADGLLLTPVDYPLVPQSVVERLIDSFDGEHRNADVVHPAVDGGRGHPPLFSASVFADLLDAPPDEGARAVVYDETTDTRDVPVEDDRIFVDIDTPEEYWEAVKRYEPVP